MNVVALLAEGVDRNIASFGTIEWAKNVALLAEGVDRNYFVKRFLEKSFSRPPRGGRG